MPTNKVPLGTSKYPRWDIQPMAKGWPLALVAGLVGGMGLAGLLFSLGRPTASEQRVTVAQPPVDKTAQPVGGGGAGRATPTAQNPLPEQEAIALIRGLYQSLSAQDWAQARLAYTPAMQSQFDPAFFAQFDRVTVQDLRVTGQTPVQWELTGRNTYFYPNGDTQEEERTYTVVWQNQQMLIADSRFVRVIKSR